MFCKKCGAEIPEGKKFCADCGTPVTVEKKNSKIALIVVVCIAVIAIICAVVFGVKLASGNKAEELSTTAVFVETTETTTESPTTTAAPTTAPTTTETTTAAPTTTAPTMVAPKTTTATTRKVTTTKKPTQPSTTKKPATDEYGLVVGQAYDKIPFNVKTKNIRHISWRGYLINESEDALVTIKYREDYSIQMVEMENIKPALSTILAKKVTATYSSSGEAVVTLVNPLGISFSYTEEDLIERGGADGLMTLDFIEAYYSDMLFLDPFALFEYHYPGMFDKTSGYIYKGKETLKTGTAYKFDVDYPETGELIHIWIDEDSGALAKITITYQGKETTYFEASEIKF